MDKLKNIPHLESNEILKALEVQFFCSEHNIYIYFKCIYLLQMSSISHVKWMEYLLFSAVLAINIFWRLLKDSFRTYFVPYLCACFICCTDTKQYCRNKRCTVLIPLLVPLSAHNKHTHTRTTRSLVFHLIRMLLLLPRFWLQKQMSNGDRPWRIIHSILEDVQYLVNVKVCISIISIPTWISLCLHCKWMPKAEKKTMLQLSTQLCVADTVSPSIMNAVPMTLRSCIHLLL